MELGPNELAGAQAARELGGHESPLGAFPISQTTGVRVLRSLRRDN